MYQTLIHTHIHKNTLNFNGLLQQMTVFDQMKNFFFFKFGSKREIIKNLIYEPTIEFKCINFQTQQK